jgi:two-component system, chemotaxis family, sensor kinase CheA
MARKSLVIHGQWLQIAATVLFAAALTVLLVIGMKRANELQSESAALQVASELTSRPRIIRSELTLVEHGLETTSFIGESLRNLTAIRADTNQAFRVLQEQLQRGALAEDAAVATQLSDAWNRWQALDRELQALDRKSGTEFYVDTANGSELAAAGRQVKVAVDTMLSPQSQSMRLSTDSLRRLATTLRAAVADSDRSLRSLLLGGTAVAAILLGMMLYYAWRSRQSTAAAVSAQRQVANILSTVREGLFLVDRDLRLGETFSDSLTELLHVEDPAGRSFQEVLRPLVDEKTLITSLKFLRLLWKDNVHEELIESVNPLNQIEVSFNTLRGPADIRYLAFAFRRVRGQDSTGDYLLGVVSDVTDRVLLAREVEQVKADSESQASVLLQVLRVDPASLQGFLSAADVALRKSNAMLTEPGIEQDHLRQKLNGVFRELHTVKGEAAALNLSTFAQRIHAIEDRLSALRAKDPLDGNDFLPVVVKLDELMSHIANIQSMQDRMATVKPTNVTGRFRQAHDTSHADVPVLSEPAQLGAPRASAAGTYLRDLLRSVAQEAANAHSVSLRIVTRGLEAVPTAYLGPVKDICIHMIRNSVVHGIESAAERRARGKSEEGTLTVSFAGDTAEDYLLSIEDDGRGLSYDQIVDKALRLGLVSPQQAAGIDHSAIYRLIFKPGFSTVDKVSEHAGRGVGLDAVSNVIRSCGGKIGVSTAAGQYTRFKVWFPKLTAAQEHGVSAA